MISSVDLSLLPALDALLSEENVTRAAMRLGISQAALSVKLRRLRDLTGDQLLVQSVKGRGMTPTPYAIALRSRVREAIAMGEAALSNSAAFDPSTSRATLRIIANDNAASLTLAVLLAEMNSSQAKGLRLAILRPDGTRLADRLEAGEADLAISADDHLPGGDGLHRRAILRDKYATAQRVGHPRGTNDLDMEAFCAASHLIVSDSAAFEGMVDAALKSERRQRKVALSIHSYLLAPMIVARSDLLVTLPRQLLEQYGSELDLFEPPLSLPEIALKAFWHQRTHEDPVNKWARDHLLSAANYRSALPRPEKTF